MERDYNWVAETVLEQISPQDDHERRMHVVVDALWEQLHDKGISWVGFYLKVPDEDHMMLGPCRDKPACSPIGMHGACGQAFEQQTPLLVDDVRELGADYIACDPRDQSEVVVPVVSQTGRVMGVLDLDSFDLQAFDQADVRGLSHVLRSAGLHAGDA